MRLKGEKDRMKTEAHTGRISLKDQRDLTKSHSGDHIMMAQVKEKLSQGLRFCKRKQKKRKKKKKRKRRGEWG